MSQAYQPYTPAEYRPMPKIELPDHERGMSLHDIRRFDRASSRLARVDLSPRQREIALRERETLETGPRVARDAADIAAGISETEALARGRGEATETDRAGVKRMIDRDPLLTIARAGRLSEVQLDTAQTLRLLYERRAEDAGSAPFTGMPGGGHDHERFISVRFTRAKATEMLGRVERRVSIECSAEPVCLMMVRVVCERGFTIRSQGGGRQLDRNYQAFARALDVADRVLRRQD